MNKIYVVGIGPGDLENMTLRAVNALKESEVIVGYTLYAELIKEYFPGKQFVTTGMRQETERCRMAYELAAEGRTTALICSGDAGVYGMSGLMEELRPEYGEVELEVVPGITAALSGAALLGAPLMHDFAVISLSDLLTKWETIEKRLLCAAEADMVICIYNPSSRTRADYLSRACGLLLRFKSPDTVCGIVRNAGREGESIKMLSLKELSDTMTDMFSTVFIGNSMTKLIGDRMVTPRGYELGQTGPEKKQHEGRIKQHSR